MINRFKKEVFFTDFDPKKAKLKITDFIKREVEKSGFKKVVIGVSGGIDSAVSAYLAVAALGRRNVLMVFLPYKNLNYEGLFDARLVAEELRIPRKNIFEIDISAMCDAFFRVDPEMDNIRRGNIMARVRMIALFDLAKKEKALVCGTENKSEYYLSYFTRFGDEASDLEPIRHLYKTEVRRLARYLGVPKKIIDKPPTAGLWKGQTDEGQFGFSYQEADQILYLLFDKKVDLSQIIKKGFEKSLVEKVFAWVKANDFKHHLPKALI